MNVEFNLILLKDQDKTADIESCNYVDGKYHIIFLNNSQIYKYAYSSVKWFKSPEHLNPDNFRFTHRGQNIYDIKRILQFDDYIRFIFKSGDFKTYSILELRIERNCLAESASINCLNYFKSVAASTGIRSEDGQTLLNNQLEKLTFINNETALAAYMTQRIFERKPEKSNGYYYPFGHNLSQIEAIKSAMENQISVIEGPPGTGKTQTILNIIANLVIRGLTVAVVSNNNSATSNVLEKLQQTGFDFIAAPLGRSENRKAFIEFQSGRYPDLSSFQFSNDEIQPIRQNLALLEKDSKEVLHLKNEIAELKNKLSELDIERQHYNKYFMASQGNIIIQRLKMKMNMKSAHLLRLSLECQNPKTQNRNVGILFKLKCWLLCNLKWSWLKDKESNELIPALQYLFYVRKAEEIELSIQALDKNLKRLKYEERMAKLRDQSLVIFRDSLYHRFQGSAARRIFAEEDLWKQSSEFCHEYPVVLSTTHSIRNCLNHDYLYDYIIVDESSQVDLITGVLALSCARNAVIVGDLMQLPNVVTEETKLAVSTISRTYKLKSGYDYGENSLLSSICAVLPTVPRTILREHYRCHPKIIGFCNQKFYNNQLIVLTQDDLRDDVLKTYKTVVGNHVRDRINQRQIDEIQKQVIPELEMLVGQENIGIISPYRAQAAALQNSAGSEGIDISTVHKFQGREKDAIIITTVDNVISEFTDNPNLLNVAVSRARKFLRLVISNNEDNDKTNLGDLIRYVRYNNFETVDGSVYSVFDLLYKEYAAARQIFLRDHKQISEYDSENLMYTMIEEVISAEEFCQYDVVTHAPLKMTIRNRELLSPEELGYVLNDATHTDFLLFRKLDKTPVLVIEVDGYAFHREDSDQWKRDVMKNSILEKYGLPYLRFKTNGSQEKEVLIKKLQQL